MPEYQSHITKKVILSSAVATSGTFTVSYPDGYDESMFSEQGHKMSLLNGGDYTSPENFTVSFGADEATITWNESNTLADGSEIYVQFDVKGTSGEIDLRDVKNGRIGSVTGVVLNLGAPDAADADGVAASQSVTSGAETDINGALATDSVATFDVPRNVVAGWTGTAVVTVTGTDEYGKAITESSASGTSLAGKKAFKTVTSVTFNANVTGATVGTGNVLGLPVYLSDPSVVLVEQEDGASASSGTIVAGDNNEPTATSGDVRGTYDPASASNGGKNFSLIALLEDPNNKGAAQYSA